MNLSKKQQFSKFPLFILGIVILGLNSCFYKLGDLPSFPKVTTVSISDTQSTNATCGGNVTEDAGTPIIARGVCWSTKVDPTVEDSITKDGSGKGLFTSYLKNLIPNTTYFVRAYASSTVGYYFYGQTVRFKTNDLSTVSTGLVVDSITGTTAKVGGDIIKNNSNITAKGACWSTSINPTIKDNLILAGSGSGHFECTLTHLLPNTTYFVRAYATDNVGTVYGDAVGFQTRKLPNVTTVSNVINIKYSSATSGGIVILDGGEIITKRGVCWNTIPNPTINDSITSDGTGLGIYSSNLSNLIASTKYYVRAYATSIAGTVYGNEMTFTTAELPIITDIDGNIYHTLTIGTQTWLVENLKTTRFNDGTAIPLVTDQAAWVALTTPGYCWFNNNDSYKNTAYGALYNWYTVSTGKLAPIGWHVPTDDDWTTLSTFVGGNGGKLKEAGTTHWSSPNTNATNVTNFSALPGGSRGNNDGTFTLLGQKSSWWSSTPLDDTNARFWSVSYDNSNVDMSSSNMLNGLSIRCIKD